MNEEEIRRSYGELRETLTRLGLTWVVHQVEETIREGRAVEKEARIFKDGEPLEAARTLWQEAPGEEAAAARRRGKPTLMMASEPWSETDELLFLIQGVRQAIVQAADVENEQLRLLRGLGSIQTVQFEPEPEDADHRGLKLSGQTDPRVGELGKLLDAFEKGVRG